MSNEINKATKKQKEIESFFNEIDKKYTQKTPTALGLTKLSTDLKTDDELKADADNLLKSKFIADRQKSESDFSNKETALQSQKKSLDDGYEKLISSIDSLYSARRTSAEDDALKRGLARSSVITSAIENFDKAKIADTQAANKTLISKASEIEQEIAGLNAQRASALANFELTEAAEIDKKLYDLKAERDDKLNEITKYNNTVQEKEAKQALSMTDSQESKKIELDKQREKLNALISHYSDMDKNEAILDFAENGGFKEHLGSYYNYMLNHLVNR